MPKKTEVTTEETKTKDTKSPYQYVTKQTNISCWNCGSFQPEGYTGTQGFCREQSVPSTITSAYSGTVCQSSLKMTPENLHPIGQSQIINSLAYWCSRWHRTLKPLTQPTNPN